jgi:hypothetical protein
METDWAERIGLAGSPYGLRLAPDKELFELADPRNEPATVAKVMPTLTRLGIRPIALRNLPTEGELVEIGGVRWKVDLMDLESNTYWVPAEVFIRTKSAEAAGINFAWFVWGEEKFKQPRFQVVARAARNERVRRLARDERFQPVRKASRAGSWRRFALGMAATLAGVALIAAIGILLVSIVHAVIAAVAAILMGIGEFVVGFVFLAALATVDPILIGVIPTGPNRGLWCELGVWYHDNATGDRSQVT